MEGSGSGPARSGSELHGLLRRIDGAGYGAYRDMEGAFDFNSGRDTNRNQPTQE